MVRIRIRVRVCVRVNISACTYACIHIQSFLVQQGAVVIVGVVVRFVGYDKGWRKHRVRKRKI